MNLVTCLGTDDQTRNSEFERLLPGKFESTDTNTGVAYIVLALPRTLNTSGGAHTFQNEPAIEVEGRGVKLYDPRDAVTRFSNNPALAIRAWFAHDRWGRDIPDAAIDDASYIAEANYYDGREEVPDYTDTCTFEPASDEMRFTEDQPIDNGDGIRLTTTGSVGGGLATATTYYAVRITPRRFQLATSYANALARTVINITSAGSGTHTCEHYDQPRYTCNGVMNPDNPPLDNLLRLRSSAQAWTPYFAGKYHLSSDRPFSGSVKALDEDNMLGAWAIEKAGRGARYNRMRARFFNPARNHEEDFAIADSTTDRTADGERLLLGNIELDFTTNIFMARRIAELERRKSRLALGVSCTGAMPTFAVEPAGVVGITQSLMGWSDQRFRVIEIRPQQDEKFEFQLREYADIWTGLTSGDAWTPPTRTHLPKPNEYVPPKVSGLRLFNQPTDREFAGRDAKFEWRSRSVFNLASLTGVAGEDMRDPWADGWLVELWNTDGTVRRRSEIIRQPAYTYSYEKNLEDSTRLGESAPAYAFEIRVKARSRYGRVSEQWARLSVSNPAPTCSIAVTGIADGLQFEITPSSVADYSRTKIYASLTSGFTPGAGPDQLLYDGSKLQGTLGPLLRGLKYYVKAVPFDVFREGTLSAEASATVLNRAQSGYFGDGDGKGFLRLVSSLELELPSTYPSPETYGANIAIYVPANEMIYVSSFIQPVLKVINPRTRELVMTVVVPNAVANGVFELAYCPDNGMVYARAGGAIQVIDPATNEAVDEIAYPPGTIGGLFLVYCPANGYFYSSNGLVVDPDTNGVVDTFDVNDGYTYWPTNVNSSRWAFCPLNGLLYGVNTTNRTVLALNPATNAVVSNFNLPNSTDRPYNILYCPLNQRLYIAWFESPIAATNGIYVIDPASDTVVDNLGGAVTGNLIYSPDSKLIYAIGLGSIFAINPLAGNVENSISLPANGQVFPCYVPTTKQIAAPRYSVPYGSTDAVDFITT